MEASPPTVPAPGNWPTQFTLLLAAQRKRMEHFLGAQRARIAQLEDELVRRVRGYEEQLDARCAALDHRQTELDATASVLHREQHSVELRRQELQAEWEQLHGQGERLARQDAELTARQQTLSAEAAETGAQRRRIARTLRQQHAALQKEIRRQRGELAQQAQRLASSRPAAADPPDVPGGASIAEHDELQRRMEMAQDEIRQLRAKNAELEKRAAHPPAAAPARSSAANVSASPLSWEAQKKKLLEALENEPDCDEPARVEERLRIEDVIRTTDAVIREKDAEIADFKAILANHKENLGNVAVGAAALGQLLDNDALIREERDNLRRTQQQWEEMLRQAEVEISLERATVARHRLELEEKMRLVEDQQSRLGGNAATSASPTDKTLLGRWRSRLGLNEADPQ